MGSEVLSGDWKRETNAFGRGCVQERDIQIDASSDVRASQPLSKVRQPVICNTDMRGVGGRLDTGKMN
jgi:hypothetical protein